MLAPLFPHCPPLWWLPCHHSCSGLVLSQRRRAYSTNQITNHKPSPRAPTASDPTTAARRYPLRKAKLQDLTNKTSLDAPRWQIDLQVPKQGTFELGGAWLEESYVSCFNHKDGAWPKLTLKWIQSFSFFWIFICLTSNDIFLIIIPIGQWHHPVSAHRTPHLARCTAIYTIIWFYSTPCKGGNVGPHNPHSAHMWKLRIRELK